MSVPRIQTFVLLTLLVTVSGCNASNKAGMSPEDERVWSAARMQHGIGALDDRSFDVRVGPPGKELNGKDVLEFAGGRFHSTECDGFGFGTSAYTTRKVDGGVEFHARCTSAGGDTNDWHGIVRGDEIEGGFVFTAKGSEPIDTAFRGHALQR